MYIMLVISYEADIFKIDCEKKYVLDFVSKASLMKETWNRTPSKNTKTRDDEPLHIITCYVIHGDPLEKLGIIHEL